MLSMVGLWLVYLKNRSIYQCCLWLVYGWSIILSMVGLLYCQWLVYLKNRSIHQCCLWLVYGWSIWRTDLAINVVYGWSIWRTDLSINVVYGWSLVGIFEEQIYLPMLSMVGQWLVYLKNRFIHQCCLWLVYYIVYGWSIWRTNLSGQGKVWGWWIA